MWLELAEVDGCSFDPNNPNFSKLYKSRNMRNVRNQWTFKVDEVLVAPCTDAITKISIGLGLELLYYLRS